MDNKIYIVTGCTGYVGNCIAKKLLELGKTVIGFCRSEEKALKIFKDKKPILVYGDIRNISDIEKCFDYVNQFVVINTVAIVSIGEVKNKLVYETTIGGTQNLLKLSHKYHVKHYYQISSTDSLPKGLKLKPDLSNYEPNPSKCHKGYSYAKAMADKLVWEANDSGISTTILMLSSVLGPGDYSNSHMSQMMLDFINDKLPASLHAEYNIVDIRDVTDVFDNILTRAKPGALYIFGSRPHRIDDIIGILARHYHKKLLITLPMWVAYLGLPFLTIYTKLLHKRPLYTRAALRALRVDSRFPNERARFELGFKPRPLEETVLDHIKFIVK